MAVIPIDDEPGFGWQPSSQRGDTVKTFKKWRNEQELDRLCSFTIELVPGASLIGFTGTSIEQADANTLETFGGYVSIYDIEAAKEDKATVPIFYESRLAEVDINTAEIDALNKSRQLPAPRFPSTASVEEVIEDEGDLSAPLMQ